MCDMILFSTFFSVQFLSAQFLVDCTEWWSFTSQCSNITGIWKKPVCLCFVGNLDFYSDKKNYSVEILLNNLSITKSQRGYLSLKHGVYCTSFTNFQSTHEKETIAG